MSGDSLGGNGATSRHDGTLDFRGKRAGTRLAIGRVMEILWLRRLLGVVVLSAGCSGSVSDLSAGPVAPSADVAEPVAGVADLGTDPAVVAIDLGGPVSCAGALVAADIVLTARHCVSDPDPEAACTLSGASPPPPLRQASTVGVRVTDGGDLFAPRVRARSIVVPPVASACDADIAFLELEEQRAEDGYGCDRHPSLKTHERMAKTLVSAIRSLTGW